MTRAVEVPDLPPLLSGKSSGRGDPFMAALDDVLVEVAPGLIHYAQTEDALRAAVTLAPEEPLEHAMGAVFAVQLGLADALGALAPPEVAVHFVWPDKIRINGAFCGSFRAAAATRDPKAEPDWLIIGLDLAILQQHAEPGAHPDETTLFAEGCGEITAAELLEVWSRHMMLWLHTYMSEGLAPLHAAWCGKCDEIGREVTTPEAGHFVGLDECGGMLLRRNDVTRTLPLTLMLEST